MHVHVQAGHDIIMMCESDPGAQQVCYSRSITQGGSLTTLRRARSAPDAQAHTATGCKLCAHLLRNNTHRIEAVAIAYRCSERDSQVCCWRPT